MPVLGPAEGATKVAEQKTSTYSKTHQLSGNLLSFALNSEAEELQKQAASTKAGHTAKTLVKEGALSVTLVALRAGSSLEAHQVAGPITIQSVRGRLKLTTDAGVAEVPEGGLVVLDAGVTHSAEAVEDCTLLLTLTQPETGV